MDATSLADVFTAATSSVASSDTARVEAGLREYVTVARAAWPDFDVDDTELVRFVAARCDGVALPPVAHAADVLLACACSQRVPSALVAFHRVYGPVIERVLLHRKASSDLADDARQILEQRLLVGDGEAAPAKILDYRGGGPLKSWVASCAARTLLTLRRAASRKREELESASDVVIGAELDPELEYLRSRYAGDVERAIVDALIGLGDRDRTLLRLHLAEHMTIDTLGAMYAVNRATAARWLAAARQSLMISARAKLQERLRITESQCDSLVALVNSRLHVSILRHLAEPLKA
jgi:RNA polymerase sigma-70 factor (ECF subfamily)